MYAFFQDKQLFYISQNGFWTEHSTKLASLELVEGIYCEYW